VPLPKGTVVFVKTIIKNGITKKIRIAKNPKTGETIEAKRLFKRGGKWKPKG